jgi:hypothetical protein
MLSTETFWEYVSRVAGDRQNREVAAAIGVDSSAISRWKTGEQPAFKNVITFARAFNRSPVEALIAAGYLELSDAFAPVELAKSITQVPDDELWQEVHRRWDSRGPRTPDL